jgi:hypothetical protein
MPITYRLRTLDDEDAGTFATTLSDWRLGMEFRGAETASIGSSQSKTRPSFGGLSRPTVSTAARVRKPCLRRDTAGTEAGMPNKRANVKNEKQYEALKDKGMSKERAARIANSPGASSRGGKSSGSGSSSSQGGTTAQKKAAGRKGGKATARKSS